MGGPIVLRTTGINTDLEVENSLGHEFGVEASAGLFGKTWGVKTRPSINAGVTVVSVALHKKGITVQHLRHRTMFGAGTGTGMEINVFIILAKNIHILQYPGNHSVGRCKIRRHGSCCRTEYRLCNRLLDLLLNS